MWVFNSHRLDSTGIILASHSAKRVLTSQVLNTIFLYLIMLIANIWKIHFLFGPRYLPAWKIKEGSESSKIKWLGKINFIRLLRKADILQMSPNKEKAELLFRWSSWENTGAFFFSVAQVGKFSRFILHQNLDLFGLFCSPKNYCPWGHFECGPKSIFL